MMTIMRSECEFRAAVVVVWLGQRAKNGCVRFSSLKLNSSLRHDWLLKQRRMSALLH